MSDDLIYEDWDEGYEAPESDTYSGSPDPDYEYEGSDDVGER